jgi:hypothetical protein
VQPPAILALHTLHTNEFGTETFIPTVTMRAVAPRRLHLHNRRRFVTFYLGHTRISAMFPKWTDALLRLSARDVTSQGVLQASAEQISGSIASDEMAPSLISDVHSAARGRHKT